ncbi:hypothetical protein [Cryptosporangium aurantiacum]|uniref:Acetylornithine deacetylase/Succinyl-diaminopimelate desuccinylase n=1 Tax=Cryptosporangium aurantiacum TaxID=134849 RepID=A0A1M7MJQ7_9ACTN|nr:hypothetical protein [Cryptosporangium aurantiacum]SHM91159.1 Acetylornithine deacetylase/Succinyl-diaminopimelate desuccinylase [Cryptosporangium aurantiacum]
MLAELAGTASPHGGERPRAEKFAAWAAERWPFIDWQVRPLGENSASVLASVHGGSAAERAPADIVLYSHLDTSLTGDPVVDSAVTGRADPVPAYRHDGDTVSGFGLGVAKAPAAAAIVGFVRAAVPNTHLLLAARGTHRTSWGAHPATGVTEYLAAFPRPGAAVVAKGGPPGVLRQEPAALYLRIRLEAGWGPLMLPGLLRPPGGLLSQAGALLAAVESWGSNYAADVTQQALRVDPSRQDGASFGLGALRAGSPEKPDLAPAALELYCYLVLPGPVEPGAAAASLAAHLSAFDGVRVDEELLGNGPGTPPDAPVIQAATAAYDAEFGPGAGAGSDAEAGSGARIPAVEPIRGWTGSTDGVVFRAAGVPTARLGPRPLPNTGDPRIDTFSVPELARWCHVYERLLSRTPRIHA